MNYQSLIYFKTVAELQHFTKAAAKLYITQPTLSKAMQNLEEELGVTLFQKDGRNVILTQYGALFYPYVKNALENIDSGIAGLQKMLNSETNVIHMTCLNSIYSFYITEKITAFRSAHPNCTFSLEYKFTTAILEDVINGHSELGLCSELYNSEQFTSIEHFSLYEEPVCFIISKNNPLSKKESVKPEEICSLPFIAYHISHLGTNQLFCDMCAECGITPNFSMEAYNDIGEINAVAMNNAIAIVPGFNYLNPNLSNVVKLKIDTPRPLTRRVNLIWSKKKPLSKIVTLFRDLLIADSKIAKVKIPEGF